VWKVEDFVKAKRSLKTIRNFLYFSKGGPDKGVHDWKEKGGRREGIFELGGHLDQKDKRPLDQG